ncbi:hypothetical protein Tco_1127410, partial [Tanacetum coccineum]
ASTDAAIRNKVASIKALEIQIGKMSKVLQEKGSGILPCSTEINPGDHVKLISTTIEADTPSIRQIDPIRYAVLSLQNIMQNFKPSQSIISFPNRLIDDSYEDKMVLVELMDREKSATNLKKLLMEKLRMGYQIEASTNMHEKEKDLWSFTIPCELAPTRLIIELADRTIKCPKDMPKDIKVPLILGRPFLSTAHAKIDVFKKEITLRVRDDKIVSLDPMYGDYIEINDLNEPLELRRNQVEDLVIENMDAYRDEGMGDVIVGKPFCREICVKTRRLKE